MKKTITLIFLICLQTLFAQQPYYNNVDLTLTGQELYMALQQKINNASTSFTYGDTKESMKVTDQDPNNSNNVLLIYGYNDTDGNCTTDRTRNKNKFGGGNCEYNREHTFARSNANPSMGDASNGRTGIVADPHNLRPADQQMNNNRGNRKMAAGSGNAGNIDNSTFYPGDEWKGDVARMMMYMYTRYGNQCLPSLNGTGSLQGGTQMLQIYLQWNVEDPVSDFEDQRNPYLETIYGNRNPFIDNPYLATIIWGGPMAEDRWDMMGAQDFIVDNISVYPNPTSEMIWVSDNTSFPIDNYSVYDVSGRMVLHNTFNTSEKKIDVSNLDTGIYLLELISAEKRVVKKIMVQ
ncbi:T9SS type A sorting domain-containing protein [Aequorivita sp. H23M31]|uniref:T9SS type A sorting domain-containing protein n=1 Tax=Aequorivita ciconiae TaxID=2494375 RepID=A0A410G2M4_9FLAO|nr:endonuclease [Aequorivita sp. H23M31]QAA81522.1 T9SS type A sorting domain-containing protein [Aequorivita sp. H23M31]